MRYFKTMIFVLVFAPILNVAAANAETLNIRYDGVVRSTPTESILVRDEQGRFTQPFQGQLPNDYLYQAGDNFSLTFTTEIPSREQMALNSVNGQFRLPLVGTGTRGVEFGTARNVELSGPARLEQTFPYNFNGIELVYLADRNQIFLDDRGGEWRFGPVDFPSLLRTGPDGAINVNGTSCYGVGCESSGLGAFVNGGQIRVPGIPLAEQDPASAFDVTIRGIFQFFVDGSFSLPYLSSLDNVGNGVPTDVPEPSMLLLFGIGAGGLMRRRRKGMQAK
jgi:hypothetical protein